MTHIYELLTGLLMLTFHLKGIYLSAWRIREEERGKKERQMEAEEGSEGKGLREEEEEGRKRVE